MQPSSFAILSRFSSVGRVSGVDPHVRPRSRLGDRLRSDIRPVFVMAVSDADEDGVRSVQ